MQNEIAALTAYVDALLYHPDQAQLDIAQLGGEYRALAQRLQLLGKWTQEADSFAAALAQGQTAPAAPPSEENRLARNICALQQTMQRMEGQVKEIVTGNGGDPAAAGQTHSFDRMVQELRKRTSALENERNLFIQFTESASERIIVLDEETGEMVFANKIARLFHEKTIGYIDDAGTLNAKSGCSFQNPYSEWMHTVEHPGENGEPMLEYYQVHSLYILWEGRSAIAHMFSNVTELQAIQQLAMRDSLTGVFNRTYAMAYLDRLFAAGKRFALAFADLDYLKYCNDTFGHSAGDDYLRQMAALLQTVEKDAVVCRTGGDEFMVITEQLDGAALAQRVETARRALAQQPFAGNTAIHKNFSYGVCARTADGAATLQQLLSQADERMYQNKLENKKKNHLTFQDDRLG